MIYWSCVQTHPHGESLAVRNLRRQRFVAFYPFFLLPHGRFHRLMPRPVFPGYVFVQLDGDLFNWSPINYTKGVRHLLTYSVRDDDYRRPVKITFVDSLRHLRIRSDRHREPDLIPVGTMVRIKRGPFAERVGLVEMSAMDRVKLLLDVFNRRMSVDFDVDSVSAIAASPAEV